VKVKPGYARNYLLPKRKALRATKDNLTYFESQKVQLEADNLERRGEAEAVAVKLEGLTVTLIRQAGETGQLYGSVSARDMAEAIAEAGAKVERGQIKLEKAIKVLGLHPVHLRLHPEVVVEVTANVARSQEEAETQAREGHVVSAEEQREAEEAAIQEVISEVEAEEAEEEAAAEQIAATEEPAGEEAAEEEASAPEPAEAESGADDQGEPGKNG
jgi:large subunit ribosomal protein L9